MRIKVVLSLVKNQIIAAKPLEQFALGASKKGNKVVGFIVKLLAISLIASSFLFLIGSSYFGYLFISKSINILNKGIALCAFASTIFLLFISTTYLEHTYFRGKDIALWHLLPISKSEFFLSRFLVSYSYSLLANVIATLPLVVGIFYFAGFSLLTLVSSIFIFILLPILPLVIGSLLVTLKVYALKGKNIKIIDFIFNNGPFLFSILYFSKISNDMTSLLATNKIEDQIAAYSAFISKIGSLPYFSLMGKMFFSPVSLLLFVFITLCVFGISYLIISPLFLKCINLVKSANQNGEKKKKRKPSDNSIGGSSIIISLIKRELYILQGEKGFLAESISEAFIPLILIVVWQISGSLDSINMLLDDLSTNGLFVAIIFVIVQLFAVMVLISSTSVSREGKLFTINKLLPIDVKLIVKSKVCFHLLFVTVLQIVYLIAFVFYFHLDTNNLLWMIPLYLVNSINISLSGLFVDYSNPKLQWDVSTSAMKRNINALFGMLAALIVVAPSILILFFKMDLIILAFVFSFTILIVLWYFVLKAANKLINFD
jgi:ABC-2 type transport system permease protein